jgi:electron transfer flavoprotein beta subunit
LNIIVCIKSVVTEAPRGKIVRTADKCAFNPFDRPVLEMAVQLKERYQGSVTVLSMGPPTADATLREALAAGADRAVLLSDPALVGSDTLATSTALCAGIQFLSPFDLLLFGTRTSDSDTGQVGPQTAVLMGLSMVTGALCIEKQAGNLIVERRVDDFLETYEMRLPAALTIHPSAVFSRDAALGSIASAFAQQDVEIVSAAQLGVASQPVGDAGSPTRVLSMKSVKKDRTCEWIEGSPAEKAEALVRRLTASGQIG